MNPLKHLPWRKPAPKPVLAPVSPPLVAVSNPAALEAPVTNAPKIKYLTIHCTATPEGRDNTAEEIKAWDIARFGQPSYHWVIELQGDAVRHLEDEQRGAHVAKANTGNIGISYVGGTETLNAGAKPKDTRTFMQKRTLKKLVLMYQAKYPGIIVRGHRDWPGTRKACPSFNVSDWLAAGMPIE
jgi:N-acetylmuramoyl-L-alanine amidase